MKRSVLGLGVIVLGCGGAEPAPVAPAPPSPAPPPAASVAPAPLASARAELPHPVAAASPFHVLARFGHAIELRPLGGELFVRGGAIPLARVEAGRVVEDERFGKGVGGFVGMRQLAGHWPDDAWAVLTLTNGRVGWGGLRKWKGDGWHVVGNDLVQTWIYAGLSPWSNGRLLALSFNSLSFDSKTPVRFKALGGRAGEPLPVFTQSSCGTLVRATDFTALPSGEVFAVGPACDDQKLAVEHWAAGKTKGEVAHLGQGDPQNATFFLVDAPDSVWLLASTWKETTLAHFDGKAWSLEPSPFPRPVTSATRAPNGTAWAVTASGWTPEERVGELWKREKGGQWTQVPLPDGLKAAVEVAVTSDGAVWVAADDALLGTAAPKGEVQKVDWKWDQQFPGTVRVPKPAREGCDSIFVLMYGITKVTPKDYDFPLTRQAIKGHTEFAGARFAETEDNGKRYFGAFVPNLAMGKQLEKLVKDKVKGSIPAVLCNSPKVIRELRLDLSSGEVVR